MVVFGMELPRTIQKFLRDAFIMMAVAGLGFLVDNFGVLEIDPKYAPLFFAVAMALYRWARDAAGLGPRE